MTLSNLSGLTSHQHVDKLPQRTPGVERSYGDYEEVGGLRMRVWVQVWMGRRVDLVLQIYSSGHTRFRDHAAGCYSKIEGAGSAEKVAELMFDETRSAVHLRPPSNRRLNSKITDVWGVGWLYYSDMSGTDQYVYFLKDSSSFTKAIDVDGSTMDYLISGVEEIQSHSETSSTCINVSTCNTAKSDSQHYREPEPPISRATAMRPLMLGNWMFYVVVDLTKPAASSVPAPDTNVKRDTRRIGLFMPIAPEAFTGVDKEFGLEKTFGYSGFVASPPPMLGMRCSLQFTSMSPTAPSFSNWSASKTAVILPGRQTVWGKRLTL
ncbi:hypothetical protein PILCRDRAFT_792425 [Piloderma croceum F 1598]|uniref:Uncharacterized protein n=1 Tax=Piloderma croceum (strain F 1598) TaxID=765440 RepID=A0A0C3BPJ6_PILCF|nr:hypothetical protein PILCRDRAFT_792425 [Piloderma croceum F 1598]